MLTRHCLHIVPLYGRKVSMMRNHILASHRSAEFHTKNVINGYNYKNICTNTAFGILLNVQFLMYLMDLYIRQ